MAGVLFIVSVPNEELEKTLSFKYRKKCNTANGDLCRLDSVNERATAAAGDDVASQPSSPECLVNADAVSARTTSKAPGAPAGRNCARKVWEKFKSNGVDKRANAAVVAGDVVSEEDEDDDERGGVGNETQNLLDLDEHEEPESMVKTVEDILKRLNIGHASWAEKSDSYKQITFLLESSRCEKTLAILTECGIGQKYKSIVSVVPTCVYFEGKADPADKENGDFEQTPKEDLNGESAKDTAWNQFVTSIRARLTVAQVVEGVRSGSALTFDYVLLLAVAAIVCAVGLVENSSVFLVSSMLISPLMGPVLAATFGTVIQDRSLQRLGIVNLILGIGALILVGFVYGFIICLGVQKSGEGWPTDEMITRGEMKTMLVSSIVAIFSGAAVALGILGAGVAPLVGVAIATSLLPPAVNAGLLWSMAIIYGFNVHSVQDNAHIRGIYSDKHTVEFCALGAVSLCLTLVNVTCIFIAGVITFKIKEVAPMISQGDARRFWRHDVKIARDYNKTLQNDEARNMRKYLSNEVAGMPHSGSRDSLEHQLTEHFRRSSEFNVDFRSPTIPALRSTQYTWSPSTLAHHQQHTSVRDLEDLYLTLVQEKPTPAHRNLSFFVPNRGRRSLFEDCDENGLPPIPEVPGAAGGPSVRSRIMAHNTPPSRIHSTLFGGKKFIVTPATSDPLLEDKK